MAMTGSGMANAVTTAIAGMDPADKSDHAEMWLVICNAIVAYIQANAVVAVTSVSGVTAGAGVSGPGTGTVS